MKESIGFIRDFARRGRFLGEGNTMSPSEEVFDADEVDEGRAMALLAYVPFLCFIPLTQGKKANKFAYEHGKQGVVLFLFEIIALLGALFWKVALFLSAVVAIVGVVFVIQGKSWRIPWIGPLGDKLESPDSEGRRDA